MSGVRVGTWEVPGKRETATILAANNYCWNERLTRTTTKGLGGAKKVCERHKEGEGKGRNDQQVRNDGFGAGKLACGSD